MSKDKNVFCGRGWCESRAFEGVCLVSLDSHSLSDTDLGFDSETRTKQDVVLMFVHPLNRITDYNYDVFVLRFNGFSDPSLPSTLHRSPKFLSKSFSRIIKLEATSSSDELDGWLTRPLPFLTELDCLLLMTFS